jgi:hypothetical protein
VDFQVNKSVSQKRTLSLFMAESGIYAQAQMALQVRRRTSEIFVELEHINIERLLISD